MSRREGSGKEERRSGRGEVERSLRRGEEGEELGERGRRKGAGGEEEREEDERSRRKRGKEPEEGRMRGRGRKDPDLDYIRATVNKHWKKPKLNKLGIRIRMKCSRINNMIKQKLKQKHF